MRGEKLAVPSKVHKYDFHEQMFLAGFGEKWEFQPVNPLVRVDGPPAPFEPFDPNTAVYSRGPLNGTTYAAAMGTWVVIVGGWVAWRLL